MSFVLVCGKAVPFTFTLRFHFLLKYGILCKNYEDHYEAYTFRAQPASLRAISLEINNGGNTRAKTKAIQSYLQFLS